MLLRESALKAHVLELRKSALIFSVMNSAGSGKVSRWRSQPALNSTVFFHVLWRSAEKCRSSETALFSNEYQWTSIQANCFHFSFFYIYLFYTIHFVIKEMYSSIEWENEPTNLLRCFHYTSFIMSLWLMLNFTLPLQAAGLISNSFVSLFDFRRPEY